jgi:tetratricopeptide (TPR) repeat protein
VLLRIRLTDGILFHHGERFEIDFESINAEGLAKKNAVVNKLPKFDMSALYVAQDLAFEASEASGRAKRIALAKKALKISPYCTDAYNILASETKNPSECIKLCTQGIDAFKKAVGKKYFNENEGYFWGLMETRPFMRSMHGLADSLWEIGEKQKAIDTYQEMLRLNPNDNQGIRHLLLHRLIYVQAFEAAEKLLSDYKNDPTAFMHFGAALLYFCQKRKVKARNALKKATELNSHVAEFLLNPKKKFIPKTQAERFGYQIGHDSEANSYRNLCGQFWIDIPNALEWLKGELI